MPRKILFRGKTLREQGMLPAGSWIEGGYYRDDCYGGCPEGKHYIVIWNSFGLGFNELIEVDGSTVGQWIGQGRIFEHDVLCSPRGGTGVVKFHPSWCAFYYSVLQIKNEDGEIVPAMGSMPFWNELPKYERIGNIHDNPELLDVTRITG